MEPVRWGIISTAMIGTQKVIPAMLESRALRVAAIASRDLAARRARGSRARHRQGLRQLRGAVRRSRTSTRSTTRCPTTCTCRSTLAAARAGKHVLCEKPIALTAAELERAAAVASKVHIREGLHGALPSAVARAREIVRGGAHRRAARMQVPFSYFNDDPRTSATWPTSAAARCTTSAAIRSSPGAGSCSRPSPNASCALSTATRCLAPTAAPAAGSPISAAGGSSTSPSRRSRCATSASSSRHQGPHRDRGPVQRAAGRADGDPRRPPARSTAASCARETLPAADQYTEEAEAFSRAVRTGRRAHGVDDAILNMRVLDALFASAASGRAERP